VLLILLFFSFRFIFPLYIYTIIPSIFILSFLHFIVVTFELYVDLSRSKMIPLSTITRLAPESKRTNILLLGIHAETCSLGPVRVVCEGGGPARVARCAEFAAAGCAKERGEEPERREGRAGGIACRCRWAGACACMRMIMDAYAPTLASELL
jgi:hypothetical protein